MAPYSGLTVDTIATATLTLLAAYAIAIPVTRLNDLNLLASLSRKLRTELKSTVGPVEAGSILALCDGDDDNSVSRITRGVLSQIDSVRGPARLRIALFKLLCDQAASREVHRMKRGLLALRSIAVVAPVLGALVTAWELAAIGLDWICDLGPSDAAGSTLSAALPYTMAGISISAVALIVYNCLSAKVESESANLHELSSMLFVNYSRTHGIARDSARPRF